MRTNALFRRSIAVAASTALLSGGLASLAVPAHALIPAAAPTRMTPTEWDNRSTPSVTVFGTGFATGDSVVFVPVCSVDPALVTPDNPCPPLSGPEVGEFSASTSGPISPAASSISVAVKLALAPAGKYRVYVEHTDSTRSGAVPIGGDGFFKIFGYGSANASSVVAGVGNSDSIDPIFGLDCGVSNDGCGRGLTRPLDVTGSNIAVGAKVRFLTPDNSVDPGLTFQYGNSSNADNNSVGDSGTSGANDVSNAPDGPGTAYPTSTSLQGGYTYAPDTANPVKAGFTPGIHKLQIVNTDGRTSGTTATFVQPWFAAETGLSPKVLGKGAQKIVVTVTGQGIRAGSRLSIGSASSGSTCSSDITVGASTLGGQVADGTYTSISAPVSLTSCTTTSNPDPMLAARSVSIIGPDGASFTRSGLLSVTPPPSVTSVQSTYRTLGQGAHVGFTPGGEVTISGKGFVGIGETDPAKMTAFALGDGVTVKTVSVLTTGTALATIDVAPDAPVGDHKATATNPDGASITTDCPRQTGTGTCTTTLFKINAGPKITTITPSSFPQTTGGPVPVTVKGSGFNNGIATADMSITPAGIDFQAVTSPDANTVTFSASTTGATPGPRDLIITNPNDYGRVVCTACVGVDSLSVIKVNDTDVQGQAKGPNSGPTTLTMQGTNLHTVTASSTATLTRQVPLVGQPAIVGTGLAAVAVPASSNQATATFNLADAAPGRYNLTVVLDPGAASPTTWTCTGCFEVDSAGNVTVTKIDPNVGGQGALNRLVTITGTNFAKGTGVVIPDVTVHDVTFVNTTTVTARVDIDGTAATGAKTVTVSVGDGSSPATVTGSRTTTTFTVRAAPKPTSVTPAAYGAGAGSTESGGQQVPFTVKGAHGTIEQDKTGLLDLGAGIVATITGTTTDTSLGCTSPLAQCTDDTLTATLAISPTAAATLRDVVLTNGDGGVGKLAGAFTVNRGPAVTAVANENAQPYLRHDGAKHTISVLGSSFSTTDGKKATLAITNLDGSAASGVTLDTASVTVVSSSKITADVTVDATAPLGYLRVAVSNPTDSGFGQCLICFGIADLPGAPTNLKLVPGGHSLTGSWTGAPANGSPIAGYKAVLKRIGGPAAVTIPLGNVTTYKFDGLVNGATYTLKLSAINGVGEGPQATASGIAGVPTVLTIKLYPTKVTSGAPVIVSGTLQSNTGTPLVGKSVTLTFRPAVGSAVVAHALTTSTGAWTYRYRSVYTFRVQASYIGDDVQRAATSALLSESVAARVLTSSPANYSSSAASTTLTIKGSVSPNKKGATVYLYRYVGTTRTLMAKAIVSSTSYYAFSLKPVRGTYTFRVFIPATIGNTAGTSAAFILYRV